MEKRNRAWRRTQNNRIQKNRVNKLKETVNRYISPEIYPIFFGKLRKTNNSCGCPMCKPWKYGLEEKLPFSQRKKF